MHDFIVFRYSFGIIHSWKKRTLNLGHKSRWSQQSSSYAHINHQFISIEMVSIKWIADLHIYNSGWICVLVCARVCVTLTAWLTCVEITLKRIKSSTAFHFRDADIHISEEFFCYSIPSHWTDFSLVAFEFIVFNIFVCETVVFVMRTSRFCSHIFRSN